MKICEIKSILKAEVLCGDEYLDTEVGCAFASDLMSDVLAYVKGKTLLLTGLINAQVVRTAEMAELSAIIFVRGKIPEKEIIELARENNMVLLVTKYTMYAASGELYSKGLPGMVLES